MLLRLVLDTKNSTPFRAPSVPRIIRMLVSLFFVVPHSKLRVPRPFMLLRVHLLPQLVTPEELAGSTCVVIDVLRATTTITHALAAGAREVLPCLTVEEARQKAAKFAPGEAVLGGERGGVRIEGFDLGNSPTDYTPASVGGKTVVFTTTNGTAAMQHCAQASEVLLAAFANLESACDKLKSSEQVDILCAGTCGQITLEDVLLAGAIVDRFVHARPAAAPLELEINDQARIARMAWREAVVNRAMSTPIDAAIAVALRDTQGGRNLQRLGLQADIDTAAQVNRFALVPRLLPGEWRIVGV